MIERSASDSRLVWDLPVRLFHWALVLAVIGAYLTNRLGVEYFKYHVWCGYAVVVLVLFRIAWGFLGTHHARFVNFVRGPLSTLRYAGNWLRVTDHAPGHNPLGAWMVLVLLAALLAQATTGLFGNDDVFNVGPLYGYVSNELSLELTTLHRRLFNWIVMAVLLHVIAVLAHWMLKKHNLIKPMLSGRGPARHADQQAPVEYSRGWLAVLLIAVCASALGILIYFAPPPVLADLS